MSEEPEKSKLVVDGDWKEQVRAEKEALLKQQAEKAGADESAEAAPDSPQPEMELPEASFEMLVSSLATQAAVALGQIPNPMTGKSEIELPMARHAIDTLAMLEGKTKGNLSTEESQLLDAMLHQLRMLFVEASK